MAQALDRSQELEQLRDSRKQAYVNAPNKFYSMLNLLQSIIDKLTNLGWGEEIPKIRYSSFENHKLVKVPQLLTERSKLVSSTSI